ARQRPRTGLASPVHFSVGPRLHPLCAVDVGLAQYAPARGPPQTVDARRRPLATSLSRKIHSCHSCHVPSPFLVRAAAFPPQSFPGGRFRKGERSPPPRVYPCRALCRGFLQMIRVTP